MSGRWASLSDDERRREAAARCRAILRDAGWPEPLGIVGWRALAEEAGVDGVQVAADITPGVLDDILGWLRVYVAPHEEPLPPNVLRFRPRVR